MHVESWAESPVGLVRKSNEDSLGCFSEALFVVADGMGGHSAGELASRLAVEAIRDALPPQGLGRTSAFLSRLPKLLRPTRSGLVARTEAALRGALETANRHIVETGKKDPHMPPERPMGSTAVVLLIGLQEQRAYWAHVGDSRLYRLREGTLRLLTADHTVFGTRYRGEKDIPLDLPHTNVLEQALGPQEQVEVRVASDRIDANDCFLLCSDGVSGPLDGHFIEQLLARAATLAEAGTQLIQAVLDAGAKDNASLILVRHGAGGPEVLLGRRGQTARFMPGTFVFPGGTDMACPADSISAKNTANIPVNFI